VTSLRLGIYIADQTRSSTSSQGIINYSLSLVRGLADRLRDQMLIVYSNKELNRELGDLDGNVELREEPTPTTLARRLVYDTILAERWAARDRLDLLHYPKGFLPWVRSGSHARVATIHDDIPLQYRAGRWRFGSSARWRYISAGLRRSLRTANHVLTVSEFSKQQLLGWTSSWGSTPPDITVTYPAVAVQKPDPEASGESNLVMFGSAFPHKRTLHGLRLVVRYLDENRLTHRVQVLGRLGPESLTFVNENPRVEAIDTVLTTKELARMVAGAAAMVFPSEYEGFGLPPLEAMVLGTPAVYAFNGATRETLEGVAGGYEPDDFSSFATAMEKALGMPAPEVEAIGAMLGQRFSSEKMVNATLAAYRATLGVHL
jgi:glycosyltransferase involved in cell wall biosynthesis